MNIHMNKEEIFLRIKRNHDRLAMMTVSSDNAVILGFTLNDLRSFMKELQDDLSAKNGDKEGSCGRLSASQNTSGICDDCR